MKRFHFSNDFLLKWVISTLLTVISFCTRYNVLEEHFRREQQIELDPESNRYELRNNHGFITIMVVQQTMKSANGTHTRCRNKHKLQ